MIVPTSILSQFIYHGVNGYRSLPKRKLLERRGLEIVENAREDIASFPIMQYIEVCRTEKKTYCADS